MKLHRVLAGICAALVVSFGISAAAYGQMANYRVSAPYSYKNLTIFLLHGKDQASGNNILTLQEALDRKLFVVYETSDVNELAVENLSKEFDVFIQSGDIVKGGKQDRILAVSIIIPARSGRVMIQAYCVESGRWTKRGSEDSSKFTTSNDRIVTRGLKLAANSDRSQSDVWAKVSEAQSKLSKNVGAAVNSDASASSLQLSLENRQVAASVAEYVKQLNGIVAGRSDVIGYAFAINGRINSADVYVSNSLFKKLWPKMLKATAVEAVAESNLPRLVDAPKPASVAAFMSAADKAEAEERAGAGSTRIITREDKENAVFEARDEKKKLTIHKSYVKKQ
jgi:hypothetical protein